MQSRCLHNYAKKRPLQKIIPPFPYSSARPNTEGYAAAGAVATAEHKFGWRDLNEYLKWYAAERYLTGGAANRRGPPWARQMPQMPSTSDRSHEESRYMSCGSENVRSRSSQKSQNVPAVQGQPLRLRAYACAGRIATLLWEHGDSLWRLLSRGDRFQGI